MISLSVWSTEEPIFKRIHLIMTVLFLLLMGYIVSLNSGRQLELSAIALIYLALAFLRHFYLSERPGSFWRLVLPYLEGACIFLISSLDVTTTALALYILIVWDIALDYSYPYGIVYSVFGYGAYMSSYIQHFLPLPLGNILLIFGIAAMQFILFIGFAFLAKQYSLQSGKLRRTTAQLHARIISTEEMAVLKERNRIALDIHNTVGHQLTAALVQIEAAQMLMDTDLVESKRRLGTIKEQLRQGMQEVRKSVHALKAETEYENFSAVVEKLLVQVKNHARLEVSYNLDDIQEAKLQLKKALYHVILESITNAIKHGYCRSLKLELVKHNGKIKLSVFNDGIVPREYKLGYGLSRMKESVKDLGGTLTICLNQDGWFGTVAELPVFYREEEHHHGQNQNHAG